MNCNPLKDCPPYIPDFMGIAKSYDILGLRTKEPKDVDKVIKKALNHKGAVIMEFIVEQEENVFPMVPAGQPINRMLEGGE